MDRYLVLDFYEVNLCDCYGKPNIVGSGNTRCQLQKIIDDFVEDTDGECDLYILDKATKKIVVISEID